MFPIGIAGYARSGKSTLASVLANHYGYQRKHIGAPLRAMLYELLDVFGLTHPYDRRASSPSALHYLEGDLKETPIPGIGASGRKLQITLGTEWGRKLIDPDLWVNAWKHGVDAETAVINDSVRFPNEAKAIHDLGGIVILIRRKGVGPIAWQWGPFNWLAKWLHNTLGIHWGVHPSERIDLVNYDYVIDNDSTIEDLAEEVASIIQWEKYERGYDARPDVL